MTERERAPLKREAGQSIEAMAEQMKRRKEEAGPRNRLYNEVSNELKAQALDNAIAQQQRLLEKADNRGHIDLDDLDAVKTACADYLESCRLAGVFPSMTGLAPSMGLSRQRLYQYIRDSNTESARYLDAVRSAISAVVEQAGLTRAASEALAIFILKNSVDMADKVDITAIPAEPEEKEDVIGELLREEEEDESKLMTRPPAFCCSALSVTDPTREVL